MPNRRFAPTPGTSAGERWSRQDQRHPFHAPKRVLVLSTSRDGGRSSTVLDQIAVEAEAIGADVKQLDARALPAVFADQEPATFPSAVAEAVDLARSADVIIIGGPVFRSAVSGFTRHVFEVLRDGLDGAVVVPILGAGSARSTLVGDNVRADLILNFGARSPAAIVVSPDLDGEDLTIRISGVLSTALALACSGGPA